MTIAQTEEPSLRKPLRLWPGIAAAVLQLVLRFLVPLISPDAAAIGGIGGVVCALAILIWWAFFSRVPGRERWGALLLMVIALALTPRILHESIVNGMMGMMFYVYAIPICSLALVAWAVVSRYLAGVPRTAALAASIVAACGVFALLRTDGILGAGGSQLAWRWSPTAEERLLARQGDEPAAPAPETVEQQPPLPDADTPGESGTPPDAQSLDAPPADAASGSGADAPAEPSAPGSAAAGTSGQRRPAAGAGSPDGPPPGAASPVETPDGKVAIDPKTSDEAALAAAHSGADWPGFRGPNRDGVVRGVRIETDWSKSPPVEIWRRPVGPGWSSFAVRGNLLYTQEQRGEDEVVACYRLTSGEPVWMHRDAARFWESNAGAGPRGTPTLSNGRVYAFGATGIVNALDARTGAVVWSRNAASDTGVEVPYWGFASSPLVTAGLVIVAVSGQLAAYDVATGEPRWKGPAHGTSYSSPQRLMVGGVPQIVLLSGAGATSVAPADGALLWEHPWEGFASLQPALSAGGDLLIATGNAMGGLGTRRLAIAHGLAHGQGASQPVGQGSGLPSKAEQTTSLPAPQKPNAPDTGDWTIQERWTSRGLKPYFNDFVVHKGHAYGFDGRILSCINLEDGERKWKGGRYGNGQLVLLPDQDVLLVLSDEGELALVAAAPAGFQELARFPAIEGKTWNHPAVAGDLVLVRNDREMAAFRLAPAGR